MLFLTKDLTRVTLRDVSKYGAISGPNPGKYGSEITPHLDTFQALQ